MFVEKEDAYDTEKEEISNENCRKVLQYHECKLSKDDEHDPAKNKGDVVVKAIPHGDEDEDVSTMESTNATTISSVSYRDNDKKKDDKASDLFVIRVNRKKCCLLLLLLCVIFISIIIALSVSLAREKRRRINSEKRSSSTLGIFSSSSSSLSDSSESTPPAIETKMVSASFIQNIFGDDLDYILNENRGFFESLVGNYTQFYIPANEVEGEGTTTPSVTTTMCVLNEQKLSTAILSANAEDQNDGNRGRRVQNDIFTGVPTSLKLDYTMIYSASDDATQSSSTPLQEYPYLFQSFMNSTYGSNQFLNDLKTILPGLQRVSKVRFRKDDDLFPEESTKEPTTTPTMAPTTVSPSKQPTTSPTTLSPITSSPTTAAPITSSPTTAAPTTETPTPSPTELCCVLRGPIFGICWLGYYAC